MRCYLSKGSKQKLSASLYLQIRLFRLHRKKCSNGTSATLSDKVLRKHLLSLYNKKIGCSLSVEIVFFAHFFSTSSSLIQDNYVNYWTEVAVSKWAAVERGTQLIWIFFSQSSGMERKWKRRNEVHSSNATKPKQKCAVKRTFYHFSDTCCCCYCHFLFIYHLHLCILWQCFVFVGVSSSHHSHPHRCTLLPWNCAPRFPTNADTYSLSEFRLQMIINYWK